MKNELGEIRYQGAGKKIKVHHSKKLLDLGEHRKIEKWLPHPVFGPRVLLPDPKELETKWGMKKYGKRFNRLRYYTIKEYIEFVKRDIKERSKFLKDLFKDQVCENELEEIINVWDNLDIPKPKKIEEFYRKNYWEF